MSKRVYDEESEPRVAPRWSEAQENAIYALTCVQPSHVNDLDVYTVGLSGNTLRVLLKYLDEDPAEFAAMIAEVRRRRRL